MSDLSNMIEIATATHSGMVRSHNEDSIAADASSGLAVLADGMGGYNAGEVASGIAVAMISAELKKALTAHDGDLDAATAERLVGDWVGVPCKLGGERTANCCIGQCAGGARVPHAARLDGSVAGIGVWIDG